MRKATIDEDRRCPQCGKAEKQIKKGYNPSGTQRRMCKECGVVYTLDPKKREYSEEIKQLALKIYYAGASGRGVGKVLGMTKANAAIPGR